MGVGRRANNPSLEKSTVTETNTKATDTPGVPLGMEGGTLNKYDGRGKIQFMKSKTRQMLLNRKHFTKIATWNVRTLYQTGKLAQVAREMDRLKLDILGVSETRWNGSGEVKTQNGETILFSGNLEEDAPHEKGVGLILSNRAFRCLMEWEPVSERILVARFHSRCQNLTIIQVYAPTEQANPETKEDFYDALQQAVNNASRRDIIMIMGDLNAKVGGKSTNSNVMGNEGIGEQNKNGEMLVDFCATNGLVIGGTLFPHRNIHKTTWRSPDGKTENQIDHIMISRRWKRNLQDTRAMRSADIGSDHHLVLSKVKIKLAVQQKPKKDRIKYNTDRLRNKDTMKQFQLVLANKYDVLYNGSDTEGEEDVEKEWTNIKDMFLSTCDEILGKPETGRRPWMSDHTWSLVEERRSIKNKISTARTRQQKLLEMGKYNKKDREIKKSCRKDKRDQMEEMASELEAAAARRDLGKLYDITRCMSGKKNLQKKKPLRDKDGKLISKPEEQLNRWREHFQEILNRPFPEDIPELLQQQQTLT